MASRPRPGTVTPMWLAHHWPEDYDRCAVVAGRHVCRRCLVLYPVALAVLVAASVLGADQRAAAVGLLVLLPLPAVVEFVGEHLGVLGYRPWRQVALTVPLGVGLGVGFARYLEDQTDPWFWATVIAYAAICGLAAVYGYRRQVDR